MAILKSTQIKGDLSVEQNLTVGGNLNVQGDLTYVGVKNLRVKDHQIELNTDESGSAVLTGENANQAGIVIRGAKNTGKNPSSEEASILYNYADDTLVVNKTIEGTVASANNAASANKVVNPLTVSVTDESGSVKTVTFDGSAAETVNVNLQGLQNQINSLTGGAGSIKNQIDGAINALNSNVTATATGDAAEDGVFVLQSVEINESAGKLTSATPTAVKVEKAGAAAAVLGKAGDDSTVNTVYGVKAYAKECADSLAANKADASHKHEISDVEGLQNKLDGKAAVDHNHDDVYSKPGHTHATSEITGLDTALAGKQDNLSEAQLNAVNSRITKAKVDNYEAHVKDSTKHITADERTAWNAKQNALSTDQLNAVNSGITADKVDSYEAHVANANIHVTAEQKTAWTAKQDALANADVLASITSTQVSNWDDAAAKAHEHANKEVLNGITADKVAAWESAASASVVNSVGGKSGALTLKGGSATLGDVNLSISDTGEISAAIVSGSFDKKGDAAAVKSEVIGSNGDAADKDTIYGAKAHANAAVKTLSDSVAAKDAAQDKEITKIKSDITSIQGNYVQKAGDTMTGDLTMPRSGNKGIIFGDMKIVWNSTDSAIEFIPTTA